MAPSQQFVEITCPETGHPIVVQRMLDPIGQLYVAGRISKTQRDSGEAYANDLEASSLRAPSRGPEDLSGWRGQRQGGYNKHSNRLRRVAKDLTPDHATAIEQAIAGHKVDIRTLTAALDALAVVYGLSTKNRH
jgi:hypothetical protein